MGADPRQDELWGEVPSRAVRSEGEREWGAQTDRAIENFRFSGEPMPAEVLRAMVMIKCEAATVNARHGVVDEVVADAIRAACDEVIRDGSFADLFPVDVFQTGSATSSNMNVNEVIANRASLVAGRPVHPNDHVNASQSSNDVVPTASRMAVSAGLVGRTLPALGALHEGLVERAAEYDDAVKLGRTHLMDAAPVTLGQELRGWARMVQLGTLRIDDSLARTNELPLGGTAVGTGLNAPDGFGKEVIALLSQRTGMPWFEAVDHFEAQSTQDAMVEASAVCRSVALSLHKIAGDLRLLGSGPNGGLGELRLAELQAGSSIMPGKVNPVIPEAVQQVAAQIVGNDATVAFASTASMLELNTAMPVIARAVVSSVRLLTSAATALDQRCLRLVTADRVRMRSLAERSTAVAMVLVPQIGYDDATAVARRMQSDGLDLSGALAAEGIDLDIDIDVLRLAHGDR